MVRPLHLILCASAAALIMGAAPVDGFVAPAQAQVAIDISASIAPPPLPIYAQPPIPGPGYVWIPGYWAWDGAEYYWVPGYWAMPPTADLLWTPGYWAWDNGVYVFNAGYWGPTVGFYGGIDYGFGYTGYGYNGGYWRDHQFYYNRAVNNLGSANIPTVFNQPVRAAPENRVSFNGGNGGTAARPTAAQLATAREHHIAPTAAQVQHQDAASKMADLRFNANHGQPPIAATERPNEFHGAHIAAATAAAAGAAAATHANGAATQRPEQHATAGPRIEQHPPALNGSAVRQSMAHPQLAQRGPALHPRTAVHVPAAPRFAAHAPAMRPHVAFHAPAMRAPAMRPHVAFHAPAMRAPAFHPQPMRMGSMGGMHLGGAPHIGGGAPHFAGGAAHIGGGGPPHIGGAAPHGGGHRVP